MENDDTKNGDSETAEELKPARINAQANTKTNRSKQTDKKSDKRKKWSLNQHLMRASRRTQVKWVAEGIAIFTGLGVLGIYIWDHFQRERQFSTEHRPRLEFFREPALVGQFTCNVDDTSIRFRTGEMYIWVKNTKTGDAPNAFVAGPQLQLVPDPKIGIPELDTVAPVTDDTCRLEIKPTTKMFPLNGGQETMLEMKQSAGAVSLVPAKSISVTFGQPELPATQALNSKSKITNETTFQLYGPTCVYYFAEEGERHGTCVTYRFERSDGSTDFACNQTPISGKFHQMLWGYCEN